MRGDAGEMTGPASHLEETAAPVDAAALLQDYRRRTRELAALYDTAGDLSSLRDVDQVLAAIVRRGRQLLTSDAAYLMLIDEEHHDTFMRVTEGTQTPEFMSIRLAYGDGIGGLVAKTGTPHWTADYETDPRLAASLGPIVRAEGLRAILGVPLKVGSEVIGVLFASDRRSRRFEHNEVALLSSLADHAAIALENASLFEETRRALERLQEANERIEQHNLRLERAADLHEKLTELVVGGASLGDLAEAVGRGLGGQVAVLDSDGAPLTTPPGSSTIPDASTLTDVIGRSVEVTGAESLLRVAPVHAGSARLGFLLYAGPSLDPADVRALERAAMVTALLLLDLRAGEEARGRMLAELLAELTSRPTADEARIRQRAGESGIDLRDGPFLVLAAVEAAQDVLGTTLAAEAARIALRERGLAGAATGSATLILPGEAADAVAADVAHRLSHSLGRAVTVGAVGPFGSLTEAAANHSRALNCAKVLITIGRRGQGATPEQLGVYTLLFSEAGREQIEGFVRETIGPIQSYDARRDAHLLHTLEVFFDTGGQTGKVAERLFVHVNTLYQRLDRIDRLVGADWRRGERSLQIHLAIRLARLLDQTV